MPTLYVVKTPDNRLVAADHESEIWLESAVRAGETLRVYVKHERRGFTLRRFFKMLWIGYEQYEPPAIEYCGLPVQFTPEMFRHELLKAAGCYDVYATFDGKIQLVPWSLAYDQCDEPRMLLIHSRCHSVLLDRIVRGYTGTTLDREINERMRQMSRFE